MENHVSLAIRALYQKQTKPLTSIVDMEMDHVAVLDSDSIVVHAGSGGRDVKQKKSTSVFDSTMENTSANEATTTAKICDIESQMLEGKLVFMGDDEKPLKPKSVYEPVTSVGAAALSNDSSIKAIDGAKLTGNKAVLYVNLLDGELLGIMHSIVNTLSMARKMYSLGSTRTISKDRMDAMLENGLWLICNVRLIMKKWSPNANLSKEDLSNVLVWVKFYVVPLIAFTEDGLSVIATKIDTPLMIDAYIATMRTESWGSMGDMEDVWVWSTSVPLVKSSSKDRMDAMLENGLWLICNVRLIMKKWSPNANLSKEDLSNVLVWVKFYVVPLIAFTEDGLSVIATKIDTPLMIDAYIATMRTESWGRLSYARAIIDL
nr:hypothetical protein [Tanacetum cinerariifolium]